MNWYELYKADKSRNIMVALLYIFYFILEKLVEQRTRYQDFSAN